MDNASFHKRQDTAHAIETAGFLLKLLPPYSSQLNPIENLWAKTKAIRKKLLCSVQELFESHVYNHFILS